MATKEDILEQIVGEYLGSRGYFVMHNVKFRPHPEDAAFERRTDSNHSDIDVLGIHPLRTGPDRVVAVTCKSWQHGFRPAYWIGAIESGKTVNGRIAWKSFRELAVPKWSEAFREAISARTGSDRFTYVTAVARVIGPRAPWEEYIPFRAALGGNPIRLLDAAEMIDGIGAALTKTIAATEVGRLLQMFEAAGLSPARRAAAADAGAADVGSDGSWDSRDGPGGAIDTSARPS